MLFFKFFYIFGIPGISREIPKNFNPDPDPENLSGPGFRESIPKSICRIINNITSSTKDTQDILIGKMNGKWSQTMNDVASCIDKGSAIVVTNLTNVMNEKRLRKASVIVMALDKADKVCLCQV